MYLVVFLQVECRLRRAAAPSAASRALVRNGAEVVIQAANACRPGVLNHLAHLKQALLSFRLLRRTDERCARAIHNVGINVNHFQNHAVAGGFCLQQQQCRTASSASTRVRGQ